MSNAERILIVEDEKNLGETLRERFTRDGYEAVWAVTKEEAELHLASRRFDLALLDVGLPDGNGFEVAAHIRRTHPTTAIIFLTAVASPEDRIRGLELGAEDYIPKPFHLKELMLRVRNALKRAHSIATAPLEVSLGQAVVYFSRFELKDAYGVTHGLSQKECSLLKLLVERRGQVVSREEILSEVWHADEFPTTRTVDNFILRLRKLIEITAEEPQVIKSVRGVGYRLEQLAGEQL